MDFLGVKATTSNRIATYSELVSGSGIVRSVNSISGNTSAGSTASTDYVYLVTGATTLTLPTAVGNTNLYMVVRVGSSTVVVSTTSSQTINGAAAPLNIVQQYSSVQLISDNSNWIIVN